MPVTERPDLFERVPSYSRMLARFFGDVKG